MGVSEHSSVGNGKKGKHLKVIILCNNGTEKCKNFQQIVNFVIDRKHNCMGVSYSPGLTCAVTATSVQALWKFTLRPGVRSRNCHPAENSGTYCRMNWLLSTHLF